MINDSLEVSNKGITFVEFIFALAIISTFVFCGIWAERWVEQKCSPKQVTSIGSCDRWATCGVQFSDGSTRLVQYPIVGVWVQVCQ